MPLLKITTGKEVQRDGMAEIHAFHSPRLPSQAKLGGEKFISAAARDNAYQNFLVAQSSAVSQQAVVGVPPDIGGQWFTQSFDIEGGEILRLAVKRRNGKNSLIIPGAQFIQMRDNAPLMQLRLRLVGQETSSLTHAEIVGKFDLLTMDAAIAKGVYVPPHLEHLFADINTQNLFSTTELEPGVAAAPDTTVRQTVETESGEKKILVKKKPARRLRL